MAHFAVEPFATTSTGRWCDVERSPRLAQAYILRTADRSLIALHLSSLEKFWSGLVAALDAPALAADPRFDTRDSRIANYDALAASSISASRQHSLSYWTERLAPQRRSIRAGPFVIEVIEDPQVATLT